MTLLETFVKNQTKGKESHPEIKPGAVIRIHQKFVEVLTQTKSKKQAKTKEADKVKERMQIFEGTVISRRGKNPSSVITVRKISDGVGVEYIFPLDLPSIKKIELVKQNKVRRAKLYYLRNKTGKAARFKDVKDAIPSTEKQKTAMPSEAVK